MAMTDAEIESMEAGPEMDKAIYRCVCKATAPCDRRITKLSCPSASWSDAIGAADSYGLLIAHYLCKGCYGTWTVFRREPQRLIDESATGPLAICRAILKLANRKEPA